MISGKIRSYQVRYERITDYFRTTSCDVVTTCGSFKLMFVTMDMVMPKARKKVDDVTEIAKRNPRVDLAKVRAAEDMLKKVERQDGDTAKYSLVSPFDRRFSQERRARHELALDLNPRR